MTPTPEPRGEDEVHALAFGRVILTLREKKKLTQTALAESVGMTQSALSRVESGKAKTDFFHTRKLADALGVSVEELDRLVQSALRVAKKAAAAAGQPTTATDWWAVIGTMALIGLIIFGVAAVIESGDGKPSL